MNAEIFLILLFAFSTATSLITEALKKLINTRRISIDIVVVIVAVVIGGLGMTCWYILNDVDVSSKDVVFTAMMMLTNALSAMLGYDKVMEAIGQIKGKK